MIDWIKKLFEKEEKQTFKSAESNKYYIEKYKDFDKIIKTYYQTKDNTGKIIDIDGRITPLKIDNRQMCSVTDDQGSTSMCAAYSICNICEAILWKKTGKLINLNAEQVYARAKQLDGEPKQDGTYLEYACKAAFELGGLGKYATDIKLDFIHNAYSENDLKYVMQRYIHQYDFLHAGFSIDDGWYNATNDNYIIKKGNTQCGGHAVLLCGYDSIGVYIQNSWGKAWGSKGFAILPWNLVKQQLIYCCFISNINV